MKGWKPGSDVNTVNHFSFFFFLLISLETNIFNINPSHMPFYSSTSFPSLLQMQFYAKLARTRLRTKNIHSIMVSTLPQLKIMEICWIVNILPFNEYRWCQWNEFFVNGFHCNRILTIYKSQLVLMQLFRRDWWMDF